MNTDGSSQVVLTPTQVASAERTWLAWTKGLPGTTPAPLRFVRVLTNEVGALFRRANAKDVEIAELKSELTAVRTATAALQARLAGLEGVKRGPAVTWAGPFEAGKTYHSGELVQRSGLWLALQQTTAAPGADPSAWRLVVHAKLIPKHDE